MRGFREPIHVSLARAFMQQSRWGAPEGDSHLYGAFADNEATAPIYYLSTTDERAFARLIRQFGGRRSGPPPREKLREIKGEGEPTPSSPEADPTPC